MVLKKGGLHSDVNDENSKLKYSYLPGPIQQRILLLYPPQNAQLNDPVYADLIYFFSYPNNTLKCII